MGDHRQLGLFTRASRDGGLHPNCAKFDRAEAVRLYVEERLSCAIIGERLGVGRQTVARAIRAAGYRLRSLREARAIIVDRQAAIRPTDENVHIPVVPPYYYDSIADAELTPETACRLHFDGLLSVKQIAAIYGVDRLTVSKRIQAAGRRQRNPSEAQRVKVALMTPDQRRSVTSAAHDAVRGMIRPESEICRRIQRHAGLPASDYERGIADALIDAGEQPQPGYPVGRYLVDIAFPDEQLAVEVDGGNWHTAPRKAAQDARKESFLSANGWRVLRVRVARRKDFDPAALAQDIVSWLKIARTDPAA